MTDKQLRKLSRRQLLEILFSLRTEFDHAQEQISDLEDKLAAAQTEKSALEKAVAQIDRLYTDRFGDYKAEEPETSVQDENGMNDECV